MKISNTSTSEFRETLHGPRNNPSMKPERVESSGPQPAHPRCRPPLPSPAGTHPSTNQESTMGHCAGSPGGAALTSSGPQSAARRSREIASQLTLHPPGSVSSRKRPPTAAACTEERRPCPSRHPAQKPTHAARSCTIETETPPAEENHHQAAQE